jgi:hypothetical protein
MTQTRPVDTAKTVPATATAILAGRTGNTEADAFGGPAVITAGMLTTISGALHPAAVNHIGF